VYRVESDRLVGHQKGAVVAVDDLPGCNVDALVEAGHLSVVPAPRPASKEEK
jgi:hypothetical protein